MDASVGANAGEVSAVQVNANVTCKDSLAAGAAYMSISNQYGLERLQDKYGEMVVSEMMSLATPYVPSYETAPPRSVLGFQCIATHTRGGKRPPCRTSLE
jgi:hypothetical protein